MACLSAGSKGEDSTIRALAVEPRSRLVGMSTQPADPGEERHHELPVEELLARARPLPPHEEMVIDDLTDEEGAAFLAAVAS